MKLVPGVRFRVRKPITGVVTSVCATTEAASRQEAARQIKGFMIVGKRGSEEEGAGLAGGVLIYDIMEAKLREKFMEMSIFKLLPGCLHPER